MKIVFAATFQIYQRKKSNRIFYLCKQTRAAELLSDSDEHLHVCEYHQCISYCPVEVFFPWGGARVILPHLAGGCTDIKICLTWWRLQKWLSVHVVTPESHQLTQSDCCHLTAVCNFEIFCIVSPACTVFSYPPALCRVVYKNLFVCYLASHFCSVVMCPRAKTLTCPAATRILFVHNLIIGAFCLL